MSALSDQPRAWRLLLVIAHAILMRYSLLRYCNMGLGDTARKMSKVATKAESIYTIAKELRKRIRELKDESEEIRNSVKTLDEEMEKQRQISESQEAHLQAHQAVVDEIARQHGIDPVKIREAKQAESDNPTAFEFRPASSEENPPSDSDVSPTDDATVEPDENSPSDSDVSPADDATAEPNE
ncbi:hypothetical protein [environmental halophage 1 AAJ-2005]|nr:hypothetical protein [environmental halophage 1 AAJ-2005]